MSDMPQQPESPAGTKPSEPAPSAEASQDFAERSSGVRRLRPRAEDLLFVNEVSAAGLMDELNAAELSEIADKLGDAEGIERKVDLLELYYYYALGDSKVGVRRRLADRFFLHRDADDQATAKVLVSRLSDLAPELGELRLERIGQHPSDPLVLRSGEHFSAVLDDYEDDMDTGDIDLRELDHPSISVRGLVRALNVLLDRHGVRQRLVPLAADEEREPYIATTVASAMMLCKAGLVEAETPEELMELCAW